jgi:hypothetical protein
MDAPSRWTKSAKMLTPIKIRNCGNNKQREHL